MSNYGNKVVEIFVWLYLPHNLSSGIFLVLYIISEIQVLTLGSSLDDLVSHSPNL